MGATMGEFEEFGAAERAGWTDSDVAAQYIAHFTDAADQAMEGMIAVALPEIGQVHDSTVGKDYVEVRIVEGQVLSIPLPKPRSGRAARGMFEHRR